MRQHNIALASVIAIALNFNPITAHAGGCMTPAMGNIVESYTLEVFEGQEFMVPECGVNIVDGQCVILTALAEMQNGFAPVCLGDLDMTAADFNCDGTVNIIDVTRQLAHAVRDYDEMVQWIQDAGWPNADGDLIHDDCDEDLDNDGWSNDEDPCPTDAFNACPSNSCLTTDCDDGNECTWDNCYLPTGECVNGDIPVGAEVPCGLDGICYNGICISTCSQDEDCPDSSLSCADNPHPMADDGTLAAYTGTCLYSNTGKGYCEPDWFTYGDCYNGCIDAQTCADGTECTLGTFDENGNLLGEGFVPNGGYITSPQGDVLYICELGEFQPLLSNDGPMIVCGEVDANGDDFFIPNLGHAEDMANGKNLFSCFDCGVGGGTGCQEVIQYSGFNTGEQIGYFCEVQTEIEICTSGCSGSACSPIGQVDFFTFMCGELGCNVEIAWSFDQEPLVESADVIKMPASVLCQSSMVALQVLNGDGPPAGLDPNGQPIELYQSSGNTDAWWVKNSDLDGAASWTKWCLNL